MISPLKIVLALRLKVSLIPVTVRIKRLLDVLRVTAAKVCVTAATLNTGIVLQELEPEKPLKKKDQLKLDEEIALKLQAEIDEEERIARVAEEKIDEANIAWDDIQAKVDVDYQLAERRQAEEQ
ncbi:hypothetical protein Tco_0940902 [Tanacetum coccineum]|uniref:Uncharacterized protein n=1 Tax=Tanacetum coccineum TaxID=301880 RepID=A0ABQ5DPL2_9ASTR